MAHLITTNGLMVVGGKELNVQLSEPNKLKNKIPKKEITKPKVIDMTADWTNGIVYKDAESQTKR